jgi:hypothetical protein
MVASCLIHAFGAKRIEQLSIAKSSSASSANATDIWIFLALRGQPLGLRNLPDPAHLRFLGFSWNPSSDSGLIKGLRGQSSDLIFVAPFSPQARPPDDAESIPGAAASDRAMWQSYPLFR